MFQIHLAFKSLFFFLLTLNFVAQAQTTPTRVAASDVKQEELFIAAQREKLLGNFEKAETQFRELIEMDGNDPTVYFSFAQVLSRIDKLDEAVAMAEKAVKLDDKNEWYKIYLTEIYEKNGADQKAAAVYEEMVKNNPNNYDYYESWAFYLIRAQAVGEAIEVYDLLEEKVGVSESLTRKKHSLYLLSGETKKATKELENLAAAFPEQTEYQHLLAAFYKEMGALDKAKDMYAKILQRHPNDATALLALRGESAGAENDDYAELRQIFERSDIPVDAKMKELLPLLQQAIESKDNRQKRATLQLAEVLVKAHPNEAKVYAAYGDLLYHDEQWKAARTAYERTLELDESVYLVWEQLLYIYWQQEDYETLADRSEAAMDLFPNQSSIYLFHATALYHLGEYEDAIDILQEANFMVGNDAVKKAEIHQQLALTYEKMGDTKRADEAFDQALQAQPQSVLLLNTYSYTLAERGVQLDKATELIERAKTLAPNVAFLEHTHAWVLFKDGKAKQARKLLAPIVAQENNALYFEHYGDILNALGEKELAMQQWKKAQQLGSDSETLRKKIDGLMN